MLPVNQPQISPAVPDQSINASSLYCAVAKIALYAIRALGAILIAAGIGCIVAGLQLPAIALLVAGAAVLILGCVLGKSSEKTAVPAETLSEVKDLPKIEAENNIQIAIPPEVKKTLDQLFEGSPYAIDTLPVYPIVLNQEHYGVPPRKEMKAPVMKGTTCDGRPFIVIKVDCHLRDEDIENNAGPSEILQNHYKTQRQLEDILILRQGPNMPLFLGGEGRFSWGELCRGPMLPSFFTGGFTDPRDGSGPIDDQIDNFKRVQTLLKTGQSEDTRGLIWQISAI